MAKYVCPSCGAPFNGKKCRNCAYESFSEEITHNLHVHKGEPLVIKDTVRRQVPYKDPFDCPEPRRKKRKESGKSISLSKVLLYAFLIIFLINILTWLFAALGAHSELSEPVRATQSVSLPLNGKTLLDDDRFTIIAQWQDGKDDSTYIPIYIVNRTDREYDFSTGNVTVNGFCLDDFSSFYARVQPGETVETGLSLSEQGLQLANIAQIQQIDFSLEARAFDTKYNIIDSTDLAIDLGTFLLRGNAAKDYVQTGTPGSAILYSDENLTLSYVALWANDYDENLEDMELIFCAENSSDHDLAIFDSEIRVNDDTSGVTLWASIPQASKTLFTVYLYGIDQQNPEDIQSFIMDLWVSPEEGENYLIENISVPVNE